MIARVLRKFGARGTRLPGGEIGPGDDAAVLSALRGSSVVSCDAFLEEVHFLPKVHPPDSVGFKSLMRAASDLAAMGAAPRYFLLSLALPPARTGPWLNAMLAGMARAAKRMRIHLAGGDTTRHDSVLINITVIGETLRGRAVARSRARPGDRLYVSGTLGGARLGLELLRRRTATPRRDKSVLRQHLYPEARIELGRWLAAHGLASAMIDLSDGLSTDLHRLCKASGVGAQVWLECVPRVAVPQGRHHRGLNEYQLALHGGDDYELLFAVPPRLTRRIPARIKSIPLTCIGECTRSKSVRLIDAAGRPTSLEPQGWDPFR